MQPLAYKLRSTVLACMVGFMVVMVMSPAQAVPLTFSYQAPINSGPTSFTGGTLLISYTLDSMTPDTNLSPNRGDYVITSATISAPGVIWETTGGILSVINNVAGNDEFLLDIGVQSIDVVSGTDPFLPGFFNARHTFIDPTGNIFANDELPDTAPDPVDFAFADLTFTFVLPIPTGTVITEASPVTLFVPAPAGLPLLGAGLLAVGLIRRRVKKADI